MGQREKEVLATFERGYPVVETVSRLQTGTAIPRGLRLPFRDHAH